MTGPDYSDPMDPAWLEPDMVSHTPESLIELGNVNRGPADLTYNEAVERGIDVMRGRGYEVSADLSQVVDDVMGERGYTFVKVKPKPVDDRPRKAFTVSELADFGRQADRESPGSVPVPHVNFYVEKGIKAVCVDGWMPDRTNRPASIPGVEQVFVFVKER